MSRAGLTAADAGLVACHACGLVMPAGSAHDGCRRCRAPVHQRKPDSLQRTTALVLAAATLYIPANVFPIMTVVSFGKGQSDTILSGVVAFIDAGMYPLAMLVLFASIIVPMLKLVGLTFLLISVHRRSRWRPRDRTVLYRVVEYVGRWSMIDVFVISLLAALVQLGSIATIVPGIGATSFAAVVVITMFAAASFDPRLIWDVMEEES